ncbi:hypothetical protein, partial [Shewanella chilikensis]|uniref:hypothetical protein n=1 Tax=Shewanella chilikensis TaxID=558541 RepID=UPI001F4519C0
MSVLPSRVLSCFLKFFLVGLFAGKSLYFGGTIASPTNLLFPFLIVFSLYYAKTSSYPWYAIGLILVTWMIVLSQFLHLALSQGGDYQGFYYLIYLSFIVLFL